MRPRSTAIVFVLATALLAPSSVEAPAATQTAKKAAWGFAADIHLMRDLGVGTFEIQVLWPDVASTRPANPTDPHDPAYHWPLSVVEAIDAAHANNMRVAIQLYGAPGWANGGRGTQWLPLNLRDFSDFAIATARRFPGVRLWMIWGEPSRPETLQPQRNAAQRYSQLLDGTYGALKGVSSSNLVIGGVTTPWSRPLRFIRNMRLPNRRRPRLDMYGHNPFTPRTPNLRARASPRDAADFSDLGRLASTVDRSLGSRRRRIRLFLSEWSVATDRSDSEFNYFVTRAVQARFISAALKIVRGWSRIYTLGWVHLYDVPGVTNGGLVDARGQPKPGYFAFRAG